MFLVCYYEFKLLYFNVFIEIILLFVFYLCLIVDLFLM